MKARGLVNINAVPERKYGNLECVSDELIEIMREEMETEIKRLHKDLHQLGKERNGLAQIEYELRLRGYD